MLTRAIIKFEWERLESACNCLLFDPPVPIKRINELIVTAGRSLAEIAKDIEILLYHWMDIADWRVCVREGVKSREYSDLPCRTYLVLSYVLKLRVYIEYI